MQTPSMSILELYFSKIQSTKHARIVVFHSMASSTCDKASHHGIVQTIWMQTTETIPCQTGTSWDILSAMSLITLAYVCEHIQKFHIVKLLTNFGKF